jgi:CRISPR-associated exonuclease Cas4
MIEPADVGGVHVKYLHHCARQLWLYARGIRPEHLSERVQLGEAVHETSYERSKPVDLGAARIDHLDGAAWVHEIKSSSGTSAADQAQAIHYCLRLIEIGLNAQGAILHYPKTRQTIRIPYTPERADEARRDIETVVTTICQAESPARLARASCRGCGYADYCWAD